MQTQRLGKVYVGMLVVLSLVASMLPWTARPAQASTDWKREYENSIGKKCPATNMRGMDKYSYFWCQCTSYVAFRLARAGVKSSDFIYPGNGDAKNWAIRAGERGIETGNEPKKGAVYVTQSGNWGHVQFVEDVRNGEILVTDYNANGGGDYRGPRWIRPSGGKFIYFSNVSTNGGGNSGERGAPNKPRGLQIKDIRSNRAKIDWDSQSGVNYFCVNWSRDDVTPNGCDVKVKDGSSYKPSDLRSNKTYYVWVQACNSNNVCSSAAKTSFKTKR